MLISFMAVSGDKVWIAPKHVTAIRDVFGATEILFVASRPIVVICGLDDVARRLMQPRMTDGSPISFKESPPWKPYDDTEDAAKAAPPLAPQGRAGQLGGAAKAAAAVKVAADRAAARAAGKPAAKAPAAAPKAAKGAKRGRH